MTPSGQSIKSVIFCMNFQEISKKLKELQSRKLYATKIAIINSCDIISEKPQIIHKCHRALSFVSCRHHKPPADCLVNLSIHDGTSNALVVTSHHHQQPLPTPSFCFKNQYLCGKRREQHELNSMPNSKERILRNMNQQKNDNKKPNRGTKSIEAIQQMRHVKDVKRSGFVWKKDQKTRQARHEVTNRIRYG